MILYHALTNGILAYVPDFAYSMAALCVPSSAAFALISSMHVGHLQQCDFVDFLVSAGELLFG